MLSVSQFKLVFFDRALRSATDRGAKRGLSRFGAFVWKRDKSSLKYRKGSLGRDSKTGRFTASRGGATSAPGQPPVVHRAQGFTREKKRKGVISHQAVSPLRELTFFGYDPSRKSVVIGPAVFARSKAGTAKVPRVLEEGGVTPHVSHGVRTSAYHAPRPHLGPAFRAELPKLAGFLKDAIR